MISFLIFIIALSIIITVHELGHFLMAKKKGILVEEFGLGYPPRLWGKKIGETIYSINWLPMGGFVRILGEVLEEKIPQKMKKRSLASQSLLTRAAVALGGVVMNFLLAILIFAVVYGVLGVPRKTDKVKLIAIAKDSPAEKANLKLKDWLAGVYKEGGVEKIDEMSDLIKFAEEKKGEEVNLLIVRQEEPEKTDLLKTVECPEWISNYRCFSVLITPRKDPPENEGPLGIVISQTETFKPPLWQRPFLGIKEGLREAYFWGKMILKELGGMIVGLFHGETPKNVAGPVGIYQATSEIQKQSGAWAVIHFFGVLSVNFTIINFLPFPALDGSRLMFLLWEFLTKRRPNPKIEALIHRIGMAILMILFLMITFGDIRRLKEGI